MRIFRGVIFSTTLLHVLSTSARGDELFPPIRPYLRIEAGMHIAPIMRIGVDEACRRIVTGSADKTVRVWDLRRQAGGKAPEFKGLQPALLRTLRVPVGDGDDGKIYSVAMSPNGKIVAAGGWDVYKDEVQSVGIYLFDADTGEMKFRLGPVKGVANDLAFSADGQRLAAVLGGGAGLQVWTVSDGKPAGSDGEYTGKSSFGAAFDRNGRIFTIADDGKLRRYAAKLDADGKLVREAVEPLQGGKSPLSLAIHQREGESDSRIAIGYYDSPAVEIYNASTLKREVVLDTSAIASTFDTANSDEMIKHNLGRVAWFNDGSRVAAVGALRDGDKTLLYSWPSTGSGAPQIVKVADDEVNDLKPCSWDLALATSGPSFSVIGGNFLQGTDGAVKPLLGVNRTIAETGTSGLWKDVAVSADGRKVRFSLDRKAPEPLVFDADLADILDNVPDDMPFAVARRNCGVTGWLESTSPAFSQEPIPLEEGEWSLSLACASSRQRFVLGTNYYLRSYPFDGETPWSFSAPAAATGVNVAPESDLVVAAYGDGTIRWHRLDSGTGLLSLFVHAKTKKWIAWTQKGYYAASVGGEDLIGWHVNRGWDKVPDFFPASHFRDTFYRPDIVKLVLRFRDEEAAIEKANAASGRTREGEDISKRQPPVVEITKSPNAGTAPGDNVTLEYTVRSPSKLPIDRVFVQVDGRPLKGATTKGIVRTSVDGVTGKFKIELPKNASNVAVIAEAGDAFGASAPIVLTSTSFSPPPAPEPEVYALVVGAGDYVHDELQLDLGAAPGNDADAFAKALKDQEGPGKAFAKVHIKILKDQVDSGIVKPATAENIRDGWDWLNENARDLENIAIFYFSGHGMTAASGTSYILPVGFKGREKLNSTALTKGTLIDALKGLHSKVIVFIDACRAAQSFDVSDLANSASQKNKGIVVFASSGANNNSFASETASYFTSALVHGLSGGIVPKVSEITTLNLGAWLDGAVLNLSGQKQNAAFINPGTGSIRLAIVPHN